MKESEAVKMQNYIFLLGRGFTTTTIMVIHVENSASPSKQFFPSAALFNIQPDVSLWGSLKLILYIIWICKADGGRVTRRHKCSIKASLRKRRERFALRRRLCDQSTEKNSGVSLSFI